MSNTTIPPLPISIEQQLKLNTLLYKEMKPTSPSFLVPSSNGFSLILVEEGHFFLSSPYGYEIKKEQAILFSPLSSFSLTAKQEGSFYFLCFDGDLTHKLLTETIKNGNFFLGDHYYTLKKDLKHLLTLDPSTQSDAFAIDIFSLLMHMYHHSTSLSKPMYPPIVMSAIQIMEENYTYLYGIEELAEHLEVSKNHLIRTFGEHVGMSPLQYLTSVKIKHAKNFLEIGETSMEVIAVSCGFSSADYFRKVFKKETGMSPKQFQKDNHSNKKAHYPDELYL